MSERDIGFYVEDMLEFAQRARSYSQGLTGSTVSSDAMRYDAILRNIQLIGEAATHVTPEVRAMAPEVPWQKIVGARNRIVHGYLGISTEAVWDILDQQLPPLQLALQGLLARMPRPRP